MMAAIRRGKNANPVLLDLCARIFLRAQIHRAGALGGVENGGRGLGAGFCASTKYTPLRHPTTSAYRLTVRRQLLLPAVLMSPVRLTIAPLLLHTRHRIGGGVQ